MDIVEWEDLANACLDAACLDAATLFNILLVIDIILTKNIIFIFLIKMINYLKTCIEI